METGAMSVGAYGTPVDRWSAIRIGPDETFGARINLGVKKLRIKDAKIVKTGNTVVLTWEFPNCRGRVKRNPKQDRPLR